MVRAGFLLALLVTLAAPAGASARSDSLWATVNVCDTAKHPNEIGVRASMPGRPRGALRRMRFRLQYQDGDRWRYVAGGDSAWRLLPRAHGRPIESGWTFEFGLLADATVFRGVVRFQWRRDGKVVRRARRVTETGHVSTKGADPSGYSAATCSIA
jgi:hypothetical protein